MQSYRELEVWKEGIDIVKRVYRVTKKLPDTERYGLVTQMQRAAVSIPANIAEGWARHHTREYLRFLSIARGSLAEVETFLVVCVELDYITQEKITLLETDLTTLGRKLNALQTSLRKKLKT